MKAADGATRDGDKRKREELSCKYRSSPVNETGQWRHMQRRMHGDYAQYQQSDRAEFDKRAEIITRRKQQPDRQSRSSESVNDDCDRQTGCRQGEIFSDCWCLRNPLSAPYRC